MTVVGSGIAVYDDDVAGVDIFVDALRLSGMTAFGALESVLLANTNLSCT